MTPRLSPAPTQPPAMGGFWQGQQLLLCVPTPQMTAVVTETQKEPTSHGPAVLPREASLPNGLTMFFPYSISHHTLASQKLLCSEQGRRCLCWQTHVQTPRRHKDTADAHDTSTQPLMLFHSLVPRPSPPLIFHQQPTLLFHSKAGTAASSALPLRFSPGGEAPHAFKAPGETLVACFPQNQLSPCTSFWKHVLYSFLF